MVISAMSSASRLVARSGSNEKTRSLRHGGAGGCGRGRWCCGVAAAALPSASWLSGSAASFRQRRFLQVRRAASGRAASRSIDGRFAPQDRRAPPPVTERYIGSVMWSAPGGPVGPHARQRGAASRAPSRRRAPFRRGDELVALERDCPDGRLVAEDDRGAVVEERRVDPLAPPESVLAAGPRPRRVCQNPAGLITSGSKPLVNRSRSHGSNWYSPVNDWRTFSKFAGSCTPILLDRGDRLVGAGDRERGGERAERRRAEEDEVVDQPAGVVRAEELDRAAGDQRALGVGDDVQRPRLPPEPRADPVGQQVADCSMSFRQSNGKTWTS